MINEREIRKQLEAKQKELQEIQQQYDAMKYSRQLKSFVDTIAKSNTLMNIIRTDKLNSEDVGIFADKIVIHLNAIYSKYRAEIMDNQQKRLKRNEAKRSRRSRHKEAINEDKTPKLPPTTTQFHSKKAMPAPADPVVADKMVDAPGGPEMEMQNESKNSTKTQNRTY